MTVKYKQLNQEWNADPNAPEVSLQIIHRNLIIKTYLNYFVYDDFNEGDYAIIKFKNVTSYSFNTCNDEGYYYGQYRFGPKELPWGEFYEIESGLDRNLPDPLITIQKGIAQHKHYVFFFKDNTLECIAENYEVKMFTKNPNDKPQ